MSTHYRFINALEVSFAQLVQLVQQLQKQLQKDKPSSWMLGCDSPESSHQRLLASLSDFWYLEGQDGRATRSYPGLVACNAVTWALLGQVNQAKVQFSQSLNEIRRKQPDELPELRQQLAKRHVALHAHLSEQGLARLHLKQTWRQIPNCERALAQIRFSWYSSGRSIRRISIEEAEDRLLQMNTEAAHIQIQLRKLAGLQAAEPLAQVQQQAPLMRANLFFADAEPERQAMNLALPLFIRSEDGQLPPFNQPSLAPPEKRSRAKRSDNQLEETPFLPSLRVYRYATKMP